MYDAHEPKAASVFQSTRPRGRDSRSQAAATGATVFQSTRPRGRDVRQELVARVVPLVSIHAPARARPSHWP